MPLPPDRVDYTPIIDRPKITWPDGARIALWIAPNVEHYEYLPEHDGLRGVIQRAVEQLVVDRLMALARDPQAAGDVRSAAEWSVARLREIVLAGPRTLLAHRVALAARIKYFLEHPEYRPPAARALTAPPGSPIGTTHR